MCVCVCFYLVEQHSKFLLHTLQVLYMLTLCDSTNINTIIEFVPNCLQNVSGDGFSGGSDSYLQFRDTCGKRKNNCKVCNKNLGVVLSNKNIHSYLKCIVHDTLLKPQQSFRITLYKNVRFSHWEKSPESTREETYIQYRDLLPYLLHGTQSFLRS